MSSKAPKQQLASVKDVAKLSGTSLGTVSRVLNRSASVSAKARAQVEKAIAELGYEPNAGARQMRSGRSGLVGILLPSLEVPFFGILAQALEQALFENGYHCLICNTEENEDNEKRYISTLIGQQVDGIIAAAVATTENFTRLSDQNIPIIAVDRSPDEITENLVSVDHHEGGRLMAEHLMGLGHRQIGIIGAPTHSRPITLRIEGIKEALAAQGLEPVSLSLGEEHSFDACFALAQEVLADKQPTALIGTTDIAAIGAIHAAHERGLRIPQDISVIGFDNLPQSAHIFPTLTTVHQPISLLGTLAAKTLLNRIDPDRFAKPDLSALKLDVVERNSTGPAPEAS